MTGQHWVVLKKSQLHNLAAWLQPAAAAEPALTAAAFAVVAAAAAAVPVAAAAVAAEWDAAADLTRCPVCLLAHLEAAEAACQRD